MLVVFAVMLAIAALLIWRLPSSFLPEEDQGYFISVVQLPAGATRERTLQVMEQVEQYYLSQPESFRMVSVIGFSFFGRGQNAALAFVALKDWDERHQTEHQAKSIIQRANMTLFRMKQAFIFAVNPPAIPELAALGGFDFELQDRAGLGRARLLEARNQLLGMAAQNPNLAGVLAEIATTRWTVGEIKLDRYNGSPAYKLAGGPAPGKSTGDAMRAMEDMASKLPPGIGYEWSGTSYEERVAGSQAPFLFAVSVLVVFLCLAALYES